MQPCQGLLQTQSHLLAFLERLHFLQCNGFQAVPQMSFVLLRVLVELQTWHCSSKNALVLSPTCTGSVCCSPLSAAAFPRAACLSNPSLEAEVVAREVLLELEELGACAWGALVGTVGVGGVGTQVKGF
jgi:hypothetical protein